MDNKKIMGENIQRNIDRLGMTRRSFAKTIGVPYTSLTEWVNGRAYPRIDKIELMAHFFGIQKSELVEDPNDDRTDKLSAEIVRKISSDPYYKILLDAASDSMPGRYLLAAEMLQRIKKARRSDGNKRRTEKQTD